MSENVALDKPPFSRTADVFYGRFLTVRFRTANFWLVRSQRSSGL